MLSNHQPSKLRSPHHLCRNLLHRHTCQTILHLSYMTRLHFHRCRNGICLPPDRPVPHPHLSRLPTPQTQPTLITAYHHILTCPPPPTTSVPQSIATQARHDETAHASGDQKAADAEWERKANLPPLPPQAVFLNERITPLVTQQPSRIPELARHVLPVSQFYCSVMPAFILCLGPVHN